MVVTAVSEPQVLRVKREQPVHKVHAEDKAIRVNKERKDSSVRLVHKVHAVAKAIKACRVRREPQV